MLDIRYKDLVDDEDHERLTRVLTALEKKDEMQQRMEAITKSVHLATQNSSLRLTYAYINFWFWFLTMYILLLSVNFQFYQESVP